ncbi:radical SAM protein [Oleidesulfovibrio sp.]|uniref:radical SAM protein n=1 Tax=Oleidesulfovibrio sp. TaxID=2909707 RepID=UPI003A899253
MTRRCNFTCHYCYFPHDNRPITETLPVTSLISFLQEAGGEWLVGLTGGEPFIYPNFVNMCEALTERHLIGIDSNLSVTPVIRRFAERIDPARVHDIYAALHIEERERRDGVQAFIKNYHTLAEKGFTIKVNYVVHPQLAERFLRDREFYARHGVPLTPRPFKGHYEGKRYPESYGSLAKAIFAEHPEAGKKTVFNFHGVPCHGGYTFLRMEPDGTILRCPGDKKVLGNIIAGSVQRENGPTPCRMHRCPCQGVEHIIADAPQQSFIEGVRAYVVGEQEEAEAAFRSAIRMAPRMAQAFNNLGAIAHAKGDLPAALHNFKTAADISPNDPLYARNNITTLIAMNRKGEAASQCVTSGITEDQLEDTPQLSTTVAYDIP